jgi:ABC-type lipoprotein export system ATPase subunit
VGEMNSMFLDMLFFYYSMDDCMTNLIFDEIALHALEIMEYTDKHIFLTGKAGTGKSTLLMHFLDTTSKNIVLLAPTGVAALNI